MIEGGVGVLINFSVYLLSWTVFAYEFVSFQRRFLTMKRKAIQREAHEGIY